MPSIWRRPPMNQYNDKANDVFAFCNGASLWIHSSSFISHTHTHAQMLKTVKHFEWPLCYTGSMWSVLLCTLVRFSRHLVTQCQPATFCLLIASTQNELIVCLFSNWVNIVKIKKIQEISGVVFFLSRASSSFKSTSFTHYINMSQKDIHKPKSVASWQEAFVPCGCQKWHHNHREGWGRRTEQLLTSAFYSVHLTVSDSTVNISLKGVALISLSLVLLLHEPPFNNHL